MLIVKEHNKTIYEMKPKNLHQNIPIYHQEFIVEPSCLLSVL